MSSSQIERYDLVYSIYSDRKTVFRLPDIALMVGETDAISLNKKLNYLVKKGRLLNPRKGIYAKPGYSREEFACRIYRPSYISLEYVLQKAGVVFQYSSQISSVSYLNRTIENNEIAYSFYKIKGNILVDTLGIIRNDNHVNIATPERALTDLFYLNGETYIDNIKSLNKELIFKILPIYHSNTLNNRIFKLFKND